MIVLSDGPARHRLGWRWTRVGSGGASPWYVVDGIEAWAAYVPLDAASQSASYADITGNGRDVTVGDTAPDFSASYGWYINDFGMYLLTPSFPQQADQSQTMMIQFSDFSETDSFHVLFGNSTENGGFAVCPSFMGMGASFYNGNSTGGSPNHTSGSMGIAGNKAFRDGVESHTAIGTYGTPVGGQLAIGADKWGESACIVKVQSAVLFDVALTATQMGTLESNMPKLS